MFMKRAKEPPAPRPPSQSEQAAPQPERAGRSVQAEAEPFSERHEFPKVYIGFEDSLRGEGVRAVTDLAKMPGRIDFVPGITGKAAQFEGGLEYVDEPEKVLADSYTVQFWFRFEPGTLETNNYFRILRMGLLTFDAREGARTLLFIHFTGGGHFNLTVSDTTSPLVPGTWCHLAFVKDVRQKKYLVYRNGAAINSFPLDDFTLKVSQLIDVLSFGQEERFGGPAFKGAFDEFAIYDYARTPSQVALDARRPQQAEAAPSGAGIALRGRLLYDGRSVTEFTSEAPSFWFRNEITGKEAEGVKAECTGGAFTVTGLAPGRYGMQVWINANRENPGGYPGDFQVWETFIVQGPGEKNLDIDLMKVIRLISPQDNNTGMTRWDASCEGKHSFESPVRFAWESLGPNVEYRYTIDNKPNKTSDTGLLAEFQQDDRGKCHSFSLMAYRNGRPVGQMLTHGVNGGLGWDYRFRVE
jgi:hypothetical protein